METLEGDEIRRRSPNFVTQWKKELSRSRRCLRPKWLRQMPRALLYWLQYWKKSWGNINKVRRKKMFSPESVTKLDLIRLDLTVLCKTCVVCREVVGLLRIDGYWFGRGWTSGGAGGLAKWPHSFWAVLKNDVVNCYRRAAKINFRNANCKSFFCLTKNVYVLHNFLDK